MVVYNLNVDPSFFFSLFDTGIQYLIVWRNFLCTGMKFKEAANEVKGVLVKHLGRDAYPVQPRPQVLLFSFR